MEENQFKPLPQPDHKPAPKRESPSYFGPVVLIAGGSYFLLNNLGLLPELNWAAAARLWPLLLIFGGLNMILRQFRRPFGSMLSLFTALAAVLTFGYVLLGPVLPETLQPLATTGTVNMQRVIYDSSADVADVEIDFNGAGGDLFALSDDSNLVEADISYINELEVDWREGDRDRASLQIDTDDRNGSVLGAATGLLFGPEHRWQIGLSPDIAYVMELDLASGQTQLDLSELQLDSLAVDGGSGRASLTLPDGDYTVTYDLGSGVTTVQLGTGGMQEILLDGGSGQLILIVPAGTPVRIEVEEGSGGLSLDDRFTRVGENGDNAIWETEGFDPNTPHASIYLDIGSGSVRSELP